MKVFFDTNVLVSALTTRKGLCAKVVSFVAEKHKLITGEVVLHELREVLRKNFKLPEEVIQGYLEMLLEEYVVAKPTRTLNVTVRDPDDVLVLASALEAKADVLVTGDQDLLTLRETAGIKILSPRELWDLLKKEA